MMNSFPLCDQEAASCSSSSGGAGGGGDSGKIRARDNEEGEEEQNNYPTDESIGRFISTVRKVKSPRKRRKIQEEEAPIEEIHAPSDASLIQMRIANFPENVKALNSINLDEQLKSATYFRSMMSSDKLSLIIDLILEHGVAKRLIDLLKTTSSESLQIEILWTVTNFACGQPRQSKFLFDESAVSVLLYFIQAAPQTIAEQAMWAIGNLVADYNYAQRLMGETSIVSTILWRLAIDDGDRPLENPTLLGMRHAAWILSSLARVLRSDTPSDSGAHSSMLVACSVLLQSLDIEVLIDALGLLSGLCESSADGAAQVLELGILGRVAQLASTPVAPAVKASSSSGSGSNSSSSSGEQSTSVRKSAIRSICCILMTAKVSELLGVLHPKFSVLSLVFNELLNPVDCDIEHRKDLTAAILSLISKQPIVIRKVLDADILRIFGEYFEMGIHDLAILVVKCFCMILCKCDEELIAPVFQMVYKSMTTITKSPDVDITAAVVTAFNRVLTSQRVIEYLSGNTEAYENIIECLAEISTTHATGSTARMAANIEDTLRTRILN